MWTYFVNGSACLRCPDLLRRDREGEVSVALRDHVLGAFGVRIHQRLSAAKGSGVRFGDLSSPAGNS